MQTLVLPFPDPQVWRILAQTVPAALPSPVAENDSCEPARKRAASVREAPSSVKASVPIPQVDVWL